MNSRSIAVAPRNRARTRALGTINLGYRAWRRALKLNERLCLNPVYYPPAADLKTLGDLANRAAWYFPRTLEGTGTVTIPVESRLEGVRLGEAQIPDEQVKYLTETANISLVPARSVSLGEHDSILLWNARRFLKAAISAAGASIEIVDKNYYWSVESQLHARLAFRTLDEKKRQELRDLSTKNFIRLTETLAGKKAAYIFGTGPSLSRALEFDLGDSVRIVCNSIVKNRPLLDHIRPDLLVFGDPVFHFSPCRYAAQWRELLVEAVMGSDMFLMTQEEFLPLLLAHHPDLASRAIGIPVANGPINFPAPERFFVRGSNNIMTSLMLPAASALAETTYVIGADGRSANENYFWRHDPAAQLGDLMESAFETHPSFFRDRIYADYYREHCRYLDELLAYGETCGKRYISATPSLIPALARRNDIERFE